MLTLTEDDIRKRGRQELARRVVQKIHDHIGQQNKKQQDTKPVGPDGLPDMSGNENNTNIELGNPLHELRDSKWIEGKNTIAGTGDGPPL